MKDEKTANSARPTVDFIVPTWNNPAILKNFLVSLTRNTMEPFRVIVVNNGTTEVYTDIPNDPRVKVLQMDSNKGWMGGVNAGIKWCLANDPAPFLCWINDDVQILDHDYGWLTKMLKAFEKPGVGAVGPTSNAVMGYQTTSIIGLPPYIESTMLSGLCFLVRREVVENIGFLDESLPGGDDVDYSMRVRQAGYRLAICRRTFIMHHYAVTGRRVHGEYWDSREHSEKINAALIHKHGFINWWTTHNHMFTEPSENFIDHEERLALEELADPLKSGKVLDLGCGGKKIHPNAIGVDIRPSGELGVGYNSVIPSSGEIAADVSDLSCIEDKSIDGILAKHLLEHILDVPRAIKEWGRVLKDNGRLVIIVPDWRYCEAISCDPSHVHAFTPDSLGSIVSACGGFKIDRITNVEPGYVVMLSAHKVPSEVVNHNKMAVACS